MPKYALWFTYTSDAWDAMVEKPRDRAAQARAVVEAADGTMEAIYWMFGPHVETHELLNQDQLNDLLASARECRRRYRPPHPAASVS